MSNLNDIFGFPVLAKLSHGWILVAHPNGPAVVSAFTLATLRDRDGYSPDLRQAIREGQNAFNEFAHGELQRAGLWPGEKSK